MSSQKVRKAVIPAAGFGTRMYPATKALKKELFPIIDRDGRAKPIILAIVEEALSGGIEEVGIVVQESDRNLFHDLLKSPPKTELWQKLSQENQEYSQYLAEIGDRITILTQQEQEGFGHAVFCARDWVDNQPFLLLLGDHIYTSDGELSCAAQMVNTYHQKATSIIGVTIMPGEIIHKAGCVAGNWQAEKSILEISQIYEKPTLDYAKQHLQVSGMEKDQFLGIFGMYILESAIFDLLELEITQNQRLKGEFQLTTCLERLRQTPGAIAYLVQGQHYDTGMPLPYRQSIIDYYQD
ncbi:MAG: UTP--glucose-1-phosphate uridylyltransferase [Cyanobacteria bacterium J06621_8]